MHEKNPANLKSVAQTLSGLSAVDPPVGLHGRILSGLPSRRGLAGRMELFLRTSFTRPQGLRAFSILPSSPAEHGLCLLSAGVFFLCLAAVIILRIQPLMASMGHALPLSFFPALAASAVLLSAGLRQIRSPRGLAPQGLILACAALLFGLSAVMGWFSPGQPALDLAAAWLGVSGLAVMAGLALNARFLLPKKQEVFYAEDSLST